MINPLIGEEVLVHPALTALPGHVVWRARLRVAHELAEVLPDGVDPHALAVLHTLEDGRARSQQELARATGVSGTTIGTVATDLLARDLVARVRNPADRRGYLLTPTTTGRAGVVLWATDVAERAERLLGVLAPGEPEELRELLRACTVDVLDPTTPAALSASVGFLLARLHGQMHRRLAETLVPWGLEPRHVGTLVALDAVGPVAQARLAEELGLSAARVVELVDTLEGAGLLERRRDPADRRRHLLHLLPCGTEALRRGRRLGLETSASVLAPLTERGHDRLLALLLALAEAPWQAGHGEPRSEGEQPGRVEPAPTDGRG